MSSIFNSYQLLLQKLVPWMAALLVAIALILPNGTQPVALLLFLLTLPVIFTRSSEHANVSGLWILMLLAPLITSIPLFVGSGTGEALAAGARYFVAALVLLGLSRIRLDPLLLLRAASAAGILAVLFNMNQLSEMRVNWGVGYLDSGYVSVLLVCLSLAQFHLDRGRFWWRLFAVIGIACLIFAVLKTGTRGAWPAMIGILLMQFMLSGFSRGRKILIALAGMVALAIAVVAVPTVKNRIDLTIYEAQSYYQENNRNSSVGFRLDLWHIALEEFIESPIWGVSFQRRSEIMDSYIKRHPDSAAVGNDGRSSAHNEILNALSKRGLLGVLAVLLLYLVPIRFFIRHIRLGDSETVNQLALAGTGIAISMIICGITEAPLMNVRVGTTYGFFMIFLYHIITGLTFSGREKVLLNKRQKSQPN